MIVDERSRKKFREELKTLTNELGEQGKTCDPRLYGVRPFVCKGDPLLCKVFVAGFNPATPMKEDYWKFWPDEAQDFDLEGWEEAYKTQRQDRPSSPSRKTMNCILEETADTPILQTNICSMPTESGEKLRGAMGKDHKIFDCLLDRIKPRLVIAHGTRAADHLLTKNAKTFELWLVPHFSMGWYEAAARDLGKRIRDFELN